MTSLPHLWVSPPLVLSPFAATDSRHIALEVIQLPRCGFSVSILFLFLCIVFPYLSLSLFLHVSGVSVPAISIFHSCHTHSPNTRTVAITSQAGNKKALATTTPSQRLGLTWWERTVLFFYCALKQWRRGACYCHILA